jgi:hypothetical protein
MLGMTTLSAVRGTAPDLSANASCCNRHPYTPTPVSMTTAHRVSLIPSGWPSNLP